MTITTEKWQVTLGKTDAVKLKQLDNERAKMEAIQSIKAKKTIIDGEIALAKQVSEDTGGGVRNTYSNCSFGAPFPINIPVRVPEIKGSDEGAIEYAMRQTGRTREEIETLWNSIKQYYQDKNKPEQQ